MWKCVHFDQHWRTDVREGLQELTGETDEHGAHVARSKCPHLIEEDWHVPCQTPHEDVEACCSRIIRSAMSTSAGFPSTSRSRTGREEVRRGFYHQLGERVEWVWVEEEVRREREGGEREKGVGRGVEASAERLDRNCDTEWRRLPSEAPPLAFQGKHDRSQRSFWRCCKVQICH